MRSLVLSLSWCVAMAAAVGCGDSTAQVTTEGSTTGASTGPGSTSTDTNPTTTGATSGATNPTTGPVTTGPATTTDPGTTSDASATTDASAGTSTGPDSSTGGVMTGSTSDAMTSGSTGGVVCMNAAPAAPTIVEPVAGRIDVIPAQLQIKTSPFSDPDPGDQLGAVEVEIWRVSKGVLVERVWHAQILDGSLPTLKLSDGVLEKGALLEWTDYAIRARYRDDQAEECALFGPWSDNRVFRTDDGSTTLFDESVVRDFYLEIPPDSWTKINAQAKPPGCVPFNRTYYTGTLKYEDKVFTGVGIKTKGGCGSARDLSGKASFKVNLEWDDPDVPGCPAERRLLGENHFTFNNGVQDKSATHERLAYPIYRALGIPSPRIASVRLFVNGQLWGLYQHVETIDRRFLSRWFPDNDGMLYEGTYWCDLISANLPPTDYDDTKCLTREFSPDACSVPKPGADPEDYSVLRAMILDVEALPPDAGFYPPIADIFEYDRLLSTWALEGMIGHWDNYTFKIKNNYRVYHDIPTDKWTLISTGIDQTFKQNTDPFVVEGTLAVRCLAYKPCADAFAARLGQYKNAWPSWDLATRAETIYQQIAPFVMEDPRKEYTYATFVSEHASLLTYIQNRQAQIQTFMTQHGY